MAVKSQDSAKRARRVGAADEASPLPEKIAVVLQESRWLALVALALYLGLALAGYHRADPGWSHAIPNAVLQNPAGRSGAWLADLLLYVFGISAWWWVMLLVMLVWSGYRRLDGFRMSDRRPLYIALGGFMTAAAMLGVDTCPMEGLEPRRYDAILGLEGSGYRTLVACSAGYRADADKYATLPKVRYRAEALIERR